MNVGEELGEPQDGYEVDEGRLNKEDELHCAAEDCVGDCLAYLGLFRLVHLDLVAVVFLKEGYVSYFLVP